MNRGFEENVCDEDINISSACAILKPTSWVVLSKVGVGMLESIVTLRAEKHLIFQNSTFEIRKSSDDAIRLARLSAILLDKLRELHVFRKTSLTGICSYFLSPNGGHLNEFSPEMSTSIVLRENQWDMDRKNKKL